MRSIEHLHHLLIDLRLTVSTAESCTGGLIGAAITALPGSSAYFKGGIIAYANEIKKNILGVSDDILRDFGAVSSECVEAMVRGAQRVCKTDCAIAVSGIAGPDGATALKPVGLVIIGVAVSGVCKVVENHFDGDRESIRKQVVSTSVDLLCALIESPDLH